MKKIKNAAEFLLETGLLFEINRTILHPLGLALEADINDSGKIDFSRIIDCRDDPEGIIFTSEAFTSGKLKYDLFMQEFGQHKHSERQEKTGYVIQIKTD